MSCRRICRELLWLARFGELGPSSARHLDHLAQCGHCRDEVGLDRALVQQLRRALAERVADASPSPGTFRVILERAQAPERGFRAMLHGHAAAIASRLRTATAVTAMALAGIIASSTHVAITDPVHLPSRADVAGSLAGEQFERQAQVQRPRGELLGSLRAPVTYVPAAIPSDPEAAFLASLASTSWPAAEPAQEPEPETEAEGVTVQSTVLMGPGVHRLTPLDEAPDRTASAMPDAGAADDVATGEPF